MILELDGLTHRYGSELAVDDVSVGVNAGELVAILGPSGCGKTTIVQSIAGHVRPTDGRVLLRGEDVTDTAPERRRVGVVFQRSTLFPHMTVAENVAYGLGARELPERHKTSLVNEHLDLVDLDEQRSAYPAELSGGQQRRVELARALATQPDLLLLDEPLSALDRSLRDRLRDEIARIQRETGVTTLFVTHDQKDAMALADRLVVLDDGAVAGVGPPRELYESPPTPFVASFLGRSSALSGTVVDGSPPVIELAGTRFRLDGTTADPPDYTLDLTEGSAITCYLRPEALSLRPIDGGQSADENETPAPGNGNETSVTGNGNETSVTGNGNETSVTGRTDGDGPSATVSGEVVHVADLGRRYDVTVDVGGGEELTVEQSATPPAVGAQVLVDVPAAGLSVFSARTDRKRT